ncbi:TetR/AcrR family transcriptional regulator [Aliarcobacter butzleri]|uniref:TetR/AcrR family transcriptional regulator n=1 Tax=Aliarcobacter butzleri TaxID=28197 RepID=UPI0021B49E2E|nr:TetR/AcrR family transcriptional regulator [Aliarcobacter butzleri]MCT7590563.1 TetR/AcrR family transcriptional regulator [Aliarcobacter butzleri]MDN5126301.1 TetR/AcrR family transcriptional regulator [Aliarcobacter butzleri]
MKIDKEERAKRFNISLATYYNWEKTKPDLIKIIELGLQKEEEISKNLENINDIYPIIEKLQEDIKSLKEEVRNKN